MRRPAQRFINYIRSERGMTPATVHSYQEDLRKFIEFLESRWGRCLLPGDVTEGSIKSSGMEERLPESQRIHTGHFPRK